MTKNAFPSTASNDEAVLSFLRERGILADESITPQQVEAKKRKEEYHNTILSGRPILSWTPLQPS